ncbi:hypothetical protein VTO42DRAFT_3675 [Malbranchea cinnamomea]
MPSSELKCCCGRKDCAYLEHNTNAIEGLEKDVETAARLGQALLERHESYMAEAERERAKMLAEISKLEKDKQVIQAENARLMEENRNLVDQLEDMNQALCESDAQIRSLTTSLESTQLEVRRLTVASSRAALLESQLSSLEAEQARLQEKLAISEENEKSAVQRWKKAEITLRDLHDQLDKMERESREERQKHAELLERLEKKTPSEVEMDSEVGRPKGAAATSSLHRPKNGTNVVSHFVRDILQDNANLQMSIVELREMLQNSDEEIRNLREQILLHQPLGQKPNEASKNTKILPLSEELQHNSPIPVSQELHIHHHYHGGGSSVLSKKDKLHFSLPHRRKKRRPVFPPTLYESPSGTTTSRPTASHTPTESTSSVSTSPTSNSFLSSCRNNRWSSSSSGQILSSSPSSPQSANQPALIFDRVERGFESSLPTSPESSCFSPPVLKSHLRLRSSGNSFPSICETDELRDQTPGSPSQKRVEVEKRLNKGNITLDGRRNNTHFNDRDVQIRHGEEIVEPPGMTRARILNSLSASAPTREKFNGRPSSQYRSMKRSTSHESLISVSGMDIHSTVPSPQHYLKSYFGFHAKPPRRISSAGTIFSSVNPVVSYTNITIPKITVKGGESHISSSLSLLSSISSTSGIQPKNSPASSAAASIYSKSGTPAPPKPLRIGKRVGGWVIGRLTGSPTSSSEAFSSPSSDVEDTSSMHCSETGNARTTLATSAPPVSRLPGVNQQGPILWLRPPPRAPSSIHPTTVDKELLQESLQE